MWSECVALRPFPKDWQRKRIGDFAHIKGGKRLPKGASLIETPTKHPYLRIVDFKDGHIDKSNLKFVSDEVFQAISRYTISSNDIYISIVGTIGLVGTIDKSLNGANLTENAAKISIIDRSIDRNFLVSFLRSKWGQSQILSLTVGAVQPKLALHRIADIVVPVPPIKEQQAIASILGALDDKIELNRRMNETLEAMARAIFKSWFVDFEPVRYKAAGQPPPGLAPHIADLFPDGFEDSELGEIPRGGEVSKISDFAKVSSGKRPAKRYEIQTDEFKVPLWGGNGPMAYVKSPLYTTPIILTGRVGTLGSVFRITSPCWPSDNTLVLQIKHDIFFEFLYILLKNNIDFGSLNRGSTQPLLTQTDLQNQKFISPPLKVIKHFHLIAKLIFKKIDITNNENIKLTNIRDTLLPKLISGEIRVRDAERFLEQQI